MKNISAIIIALMLVLTLTQCKKQENNDGNNQNTQKVKVSCVVPINNGPKSEFDNLMTDGTIQWSAGTERIYLAIPDETNPQIVELTAFTTIESNVLVFEAEVAEGIIKAGEYDVFYLGNSKNLSEPYITETIENDFVTSISGTIASQGGNLNDLGYCHVAKTTVTADTNGEDVVLSLNGTLKNLIAIACLDLEDITNLNGNAIIGTEYTLHYNEETNKFDFVVAEDASANISVTAGTSISYVVLFPNAAANVDLKNNKNMKTTFVGGIEANKIYCQRISDVEYYPLAWIENAEINGHAYVDLGLPSGLKWATCNVGAETPESYGSYYAWGELTTKTEYTADNSSTANEAMSDISGNATYDVATANWGSTWRIPTSDEIDELLNNCTWTWTTQNDVYGYIAEGPNGNSIFLPATGCWSKSNHVGVGVYGAFWSSTSNILNGTILSKALYVKYKDEVASQYLNPTSRFLGLCIRPVSE